MANVKVYLATDYDVCLCHLLHVGVSLHDVLEGHCKNINGGVLYVLFVCAFALCVMFVVVVCM